jgi:formylglycine-generating enzyme required for sulfatase activity
MTESEREYVTRAGTTTMFWTGPTLTLDQANYDLPTVARAPTPVEAAIIAKLRHRTVPVDSFRPNPWGLYNVHGNVWDWTQDCWRGHLTGETAAHLAGASEDCGTRVARGGSWNDYHTEARSAFRIGFDANSRNPLQGFRVARELP